MYNEQLVKALTAEEFIDEVNADPQFKDAALISAYIVGFFGTPTKKETDTVRSAIDITVATLGASAHDLWKFDSAAATALWANAELAKLSSEDKCVWLDLHNEIWEQSSPVYRKEVPDSPEVTE